MNMCPARPTAIRAHTRVEHHPWTVRARLAGRVKLCARVESSVALAEQLAVRTAAELHGCCCASVSLAAALLRQRSSVNISTAWPGAVVKGTESESPARSLVLHTASATVARSARLEDQVGLDGESYAKNATRAAWRFSRSGRSI